MEQRIKIREFSLMTGTTRLFSQTYNNPDYSTVKIETPSDAALLFFSPQRLENARDAYLRGQLLAHERYQRNGKELLHHEWNMFQKESEWEKDLREDLDGLAGIERYIEALWLKRSLAKYLLIGKTPKMLFDEKEKLFAARHQCYDDAWRIINDGIAELKHHNDIRDLIDASKESRDITHNLRAAADRRLKTCQRTKGLFYK